MNRVVISLAITLAMFVNPLSADSWIPPHVEEYRSKDTKIKLTVFPRVMQGQTIQSKCRLQLSHLNSAGKWSNIWSRNCVNAISPTNALITNSGKYVVTFDNWYSTGAGPNVVVIYSENGKLVSSFALSDLISQKQFEQLPRSVSSVHWGYNHYIEQNQAILVLNVAASGPGVMPFDKNAKFQKIRIRLADGKLLVNAADRN